MPKILIVEDDVDLAEQMENWLRSQRYAVEKAATGTEALERLRFYQYDLILLDWNIPAPDGIEVCREYRDRGGKTPILMLTGNDCPVDKATGLDSGADDYLGKPFDTVELAARLRALLRRPKENYKGSEIKARDIVLDATSGKVSKGDKVLELLPLEYTLLEFFMRHPGALFSADDILNRVWGSESDATVDTLRTYIKTLRKKIDSPGQGSLIHTVYGIGYRFES